MCCVVCLGGCACGNYGWVVFLNYFERSVMNAHMLFLYHPEEKKESTKFYEKLEGDIDAFENLIAARMSFYVARPTPFEFLLAYGKEFLFPSNVVKRAWKMIEECMEEAKMCTKFAVNQVAVASLENASRELNFEAKTKVEGKPWYCVCDVQSIEEVCDILKSNNGVVAL